MRLCSIAAAKAAPRACSRCAPLTARTLTTFTPRHAGYDAAVRQAFHKQTFMQTLGASVVHVAGALRQVATLSHLGLNLGTAGGRVECATPQAGGRRHRKRSALGDSGKSAI